MSSFSLETDAVSFSRAFAVWLALAASVCAGCGSNASDGHSADVGTSPVLDVEACGAIAEQCLALQQVCRAAADGVECGPCPPGEIPTTATECRPIEGKPIAHEFAPIAVDAGEENDDICQAWTLNNQEEVFYQTVELLNDGAYHHSNWFFVPEDPAINAAWAKQPDGAWSCDEFGFREEQATVLGGVLFAQSTQAKQEAQAFPDGVAIRIPPRHRIIGTTHVLNVSAEPLETSLELRVYEVDPASVETRLYPFRLNISDVQIPPRSETTLSGRCDLATRQLQTSGEPFDMNLHYVMPHYHYLGIGFDLAPLGGPDDAVPFLEHRGTEPRGHTFDPPIAMAGSNGFRFSCHYQNPRDDLVGFGIGDQEMCVMLGYGDKPFLYDGDVEQSTRVDGDGSSVRYEGDCTVVAVQLPENRQ